MRKINPDIQNIIALVFVIGTLFIIGLLFFRSIPAGNGDLLKIMFGILGNGLTIIIVAYFQSARSRDKIKEQQSQQEKPPEEKP